jgi:hypothetical protein
MSSLSVTNQKSNILIDGRAIFNMAQSALKQGKKALAIEQSAYVNGKLPSGWNDDALDKHILDGMWRSVQLAPEVDLAGEGGGEYDETATEKSSADISEHPDEFFLAGLHTICLAQELTLTINLQCFLLVIGHETNMARKQAPVVELRHGKIKQKQKV